MMEQSVQVEVISKWSIPFRLARSSIFPSPHRVFISRGRGAGTHRVLNRCGDFVVSPLGACPPTETVERPRHLLSS
jgi:hypothetical protein